MQYGHFDDANKEYIIDRPDTPKSWSNYLGSTVYGAIITNNAGGYSFYKSGAQGRFMRLRFNAIPMDQPGRYFYLRDRDSGDYWSASWQPVGKDLSQYKSVCRHGTGYSVISSDYSGIHSEATYFVPLGKTYECWALKIKNTSSRPRKLSVFTYCEFANNWHTSQDLVNLQYTLFLVQGKSVDGILDIADLVHMPENTEIVHDNGLRRDNFFALVGSPLTAYDTDRDKFLGAYGDYSKPDAVKNGTCSNSNAYGDNACGSVQSDIELAPGEEKELHILLGIGRAETAGRQAVAELGTAAQVRSALDEVKSYWHLRLGSLIARTPDAEFDSMVNVWNAYNCQITYAWSRAASLIYNGERDGLGFRDTVQDILGVLPSIPEVARERLELMLTGQFSHGGAMPLVKPFSHQPGKQEVLPDKEYRSDDCLWLFNTVPAYVKETGNLAFYDKVLPYADKSEGTILDHLRRALEFNITRSGKHGLPCTLAADWNDCIGLGYHGESVFVTFQLYYGLKTYAEIAHVLQRADEAAWAEGQLATLNTAIQKHAWDGQWWVRGYCEDGKTKVGSNDNREGKIFLEPQPWSVISGAATPGQARTALDSVHKLLATEYGVKLCAPFFEKTPVHVAVAVLFNPGMKENGAIFCHTQGWLVIAETLLGRGEQAYNYYRAYMPSAYNTRAEIRQIEPYVHCQSTFSAPGPKFGNSRVPWLSGTASWSYYAATHAILGIQPDYDGLRLNPCFPKTWKQVEVYRRFRGKDVNIRIENPHGVESGVASLTLNGKALPGNLLPDSLLETHNDVVVILG
jgi:N,N'-diacetylchitobiose phosphorylase